MTPGQDVPDLPSKEVWKEHYREANKKQSDSEGRGSNAPVSHSDNTSKSGGKTETHDTQQPSGVASQSNDALQSDAEQQTQTKGEKPERGSDADIKRREITVRERLNTATHALTDMQWHIGDSEYIRDVVRRLVEEHIEDTNELLKEI